MSADWTVDPATGRSNSSPEYEAVCALVESVIRGDAHMLMRGRADNTARLIVSQLAHGEFEMAPARALAGERG